MNIESKNITRSEFIDLLEWLVEGFLIDYIIKEDHIHIIDIVSSNILIKFRYDKRGYYCFCYDSIFDDQIDDNYAVDFILDLYNNLKG